MFLGGWIFWGIEFFLQLRVNFYKDKQKFAQSNGESERRPRRKLSIQQAIFPSSSEKLLLKTDCMSLLQVLD